MKMRSSSSLSFLFLLFFFFFFVSISSASQWEQFLNVTDYRLGDTSPVLRDLKRYLRHFGYLSKQYHPSNFTDSFDDDLHSAIRTYQQNFNLNVTGILDPATVRQLAVPRCGVPDIINGTTKMSSGKIPGRRLYSYFNGEPRWPPEKQQLTYAVTSTSSYDPSVLSQVFARAFDRWAQVTDLSFSESGSDGADITIGFYSGDHGDGRPFDGPLNVLAHAFPPTVGMFHLDASEDWVAEGDVRQAESQYAIDMESVAVHEIGHLLGMGHSSVHEAIMYPSISPKTRKVDLADDDIEGIRNLYGLQN